MIKSVKSLVLLSLLLSFSISYGKQKPVDHGPRGGMSAGGPLVGLNANEAKAFLDGQARFAEKESVTNESGNNIGLGPRYNSNQCLSCHAQPTAGGTSPFVNPQIGVAALAGAKNKIPWMVLYNGPVREVRFKSDGGVHDLYTITGRSDAVGCNISQPNFGKYGNKKIAFRIPTSLFGAGLIEAIPDSEILANQQSNQIFKSKMGIHGHPNISGNDGTITRFGWKAQNKSLLMFAGEAYNVEMGVSNELFPQKRDNTPGCQFNPTPEDVSNFEASDPITGLSDVEAFTNFMRFLDAPKQANPTLSGEYNFVRIGCNLCHTISLFTSKNESAALSNKQVNLFSDLLLHKMGSNLADGIVQGAAKGDEFRTAPLWGIGQRIFFLHDGRTNNLYDAIEAHKSRGSEANKVIHSFNKLSTQDQQSIIDFLRSL